MRHAKSNVCDSNSMDLVANNGACGGYYHMRGGWNEGNGSTVLLPLEEAR